MSIVRTTKGLRDFLFTQLEGLASGEIKTPHAQAVARLTQQVLIAKKLEIDVAQFAKNEGIAEVDL